MVRETVTIGQRGQTVIPASLRRRFGLDDGQLVIFEETPEGILIRPAAAVPIEPYTPQRKAEFLLNNAVEARDYTRARKAVKAMGLDPDQVEHRKPGGRAAKGA